MSKQTNAQNIGNVVFEYINFQFSLENLRILMFVINDDIL